MSTNKSSWLGILALLFVCVFTHPSKSVQAQMADIEAARKEGRVVVYGSVVPQAMQELHRGFEKKYGVKVEYWRAVGGAIADRSLAEWRAGHPKFDVIEAYRGMQLILKKEGLYTRYIPPSSEVFPAQFKERDGLITPWRITPITILYNTDLVKSGEAPRTLDGLLEPRWKKKISIPDPALHSTTAQFLWNLEKLKGEKWLDFVKALAKQEPHLVESFAPVTTAIIRGEASIGITYIKYINQYKGPIGYVSLEKYLAECFYMGLSAKANNPNAAKLYIDYAASENGQKAIAKDSEFVLYPGIYPPIKDAEKVVPNLVFMDSPTTDELKKLRAEFQQIFVGK